MTKENLSIRLDTYRDAGGNQFNQVTAFCSCGRGGYIRIPEHPQVSKELNNCRVYWGSHGCHLLRGHTGNHSCDCCDCPDSGHKNRGCVAYYPYYGRITKFYGEDAKKFEMLRQVKRRIGAKHG